MSEEPKAEDLVDDQPASDEPVSDAPVSTPKSTEPCVGLAELVAMKRIPDHHAAAFRLYVGHDKEMKVSEWDLSYKEFMSKPTGMSKEAWHEQFVKKLEAR